MLVRMRFRLPLRSFFRDIMIMCCGSILGLLLARRLVGDSCDTIHMVKRSDISKRAYFAMIDSRGSSVKNDSRKEETFGEVVDVGVYHTGSGWMEDGLDGDIEDVPGLAGDGEWVSLKHKQVVRDDSLRVSHDSKKWLDVLEYQDNLKRQDNQPKRMSKRKTLLVGVVTDEQHLRTTINSAMETWGQGSSDLVFYSLQSQYSEVAEAIEGGGGRGKIPFHRNWRRGKRRVKSEAVKVVSLDSGVSDAPPLIKEAWPVLQNMYTNLVDSFDWFMLVPSNAYVRLDDMEAMLKARDPSMWTLLGGPAGKVDRGQEAGGSQSTSNVLSCDESVGVVVSRGLLTAMGRLLQEDGEEGSDEQRSWEEDGSESSDEEGGGTMCFHGNETTLACFARQMGVECIHDDQSKQIFTDADSLSLLSPYSTGLSILLPSPQPISMHTVHHHILMQDLYHALSSTSIIRSRLTRNSRALQQLANKERN